MAKTAAATTTAAVAPAERAAKKRLTTHRARKLIKDAQMDSTRLLVAPAPMRRLMRATVRKAQSIPLTQAKVGFRARKATVALACALTHRKALKLLRASTRAMHSSGHTQTLQVRHVDAGAESIAEVGRFE